MHTSINSTFPRTYYSADSADHHNAAIQLRRDSNDTDHKLTPKGTQATSPLSYSNSPLKSHPSSKKNLALHLLKFLMNNWNKVLHRLLLVYFAERHDCTTHRFWRKLKAEATPQRSTLTTTPSTHDQ